MSNNNYPNAKIIPFTSTWTKPYFIDVKGAVYNFKGKKLAGAKTKQGYTLYSLSNEGKVKTTYTHTLLHATYVKKIKDGNIVDHINGDIDDNRLVNLQQITQRENIRKGKRKKYSDTELKAILKSKNFKEYSSTWQNGISQGYYSMVKSKKVITYL